MCIPSVTPLNISDEVIFSFHEECLQSCIGRNVYTRSVTYRTTVFKRWSCLKEQYMKLSSYLTLSPPPPPYRILPPSRKWLSSQMKYMAQRNLGSGRWLKFAALAGNSCGSCRSEAESRSKPATTSAPTCRPGAPLGGGTPSSR